MAMFSLQNGGKVPRQQQKENSLCYFGQLDSGLYTSILDVDIFTRKRAWGLLSNESEITIVPEN
jgi:hypothetical protein